MKKKILYFTDCYIFGGCENVLFNLLTDRELSQEYDMHYAYRYSREYQCAVEQRFAAGIKKYPMVLLNNDTLRHRIGSKGEANPLLRIIKYILAAVDKSWIFAIYNIPKLFFLFKKIKPDILHINNGGYPGAATCRMAVFSAKLAGIRTILFNVNNIARPQHGIIDRYIDAFIERNTAYFIVASDQARIMLIKQRSFPAGKIMQIFNVLKPGIIKRNRAEICSQYGVDNKNFIMVEVALLTERKGQVHLLNAISQINILRPDISKDLILFLVGEGEMRGTIEKAIKDNGLQDRVVLTGSRDDFLDFINLADLFVLPSVKDEDMPLVILNAMSLKKPIISTRLAGIVEEIEDGKEGSLLDVDQIGKLPDAIIDLYSDSKKREYYGQNAYQKYIKQFSYEPIMKTYQNLYRKVLAGTN